MVCVKSLAEERFLYLLETYEDSVLPSVRTSLGPEKSQQLGDVHNEFVGSSPWRQQ